jgi:long-chain acyl-CoA synthetase
MSKLGAMIAQLAQIDPNADALEFEGEWWRWADWTAIGAAMEGLLGAAGLGRDARIAGLLRNAPPIAGAILHVLASDRCLVTLNPSLPDAALGADILRLKPGAVFGLPRDWDRSDVRDAAREAGCLGLMLTGSRDDPVRLVDGLEAVNHAGLHAFSASGVGLEMLTSGTTGAPKRIPLTHHAIAQSTLSAAVYDGRKADEPLALRDQRVMLSAPFTHLAGIFGLLNTTLAGRKVILLPRFSVEEWVGAVERHQLRVASAPPAALRMILDADVPRQRLQSLLAFRSGTAPLDPDLADAFYARYGIPVLQNYSATEFAGAGAGWTLADHRKFYPEKRGSVGRMNPGIDARIIDTENFLPLAAGDTGLLEIRAPHLGDGSWIRTTDLAVLDADGFLFIKGRADSAIIRGGFKIFPEDIVAALQTHPAILEAAVIAIPDPRLGQVPVAAYTLKAGADDPGEGELDQLLRQSLMPYQVPTHFLRVEELPRTPSLKVSQPALRALVVERLQQTA